MVQRAGDGMADNDIYRLDPASGTTTVSAAAAPAAGVVTWAACDRRAFRARFIEGFLAAASLAGRHCDKEFPHRCGKIAE